MNTKLLIITILLGTLFSNKMLAQEAGEFNLSYGYSGTDFIISQGLQTASAFTCGIASVVTSLSDLLGSSNPVTPPCRFEMKGSGTISLNFNKRINEKVSVGGQLNYSSYKYRWRSDKKWEKTNTISPYAKVEYRHNTQPDYELYSAFLLGFLSANEGTDRNGIPAFHLTAIGFRHGLKHAFFCELGLGFGHLLAIGYTAKIVD